jgi:hypothetical protein
MIIVAARYCTAQNRTGSRAHKYQHGGYEVLDAEDDGQRDSTGPSGKREQPGRRRSRFGNGCYCLGCRIQREPTGLDILDRPHRRSHTIHVDASRIGGNLRV